MKERVKRISALTLTVLIVLGGVYFFWKTGFFSSSSNSEQLKEYLNSFSPYSEIIYFVIQLLSVIIAPIPSNITAVAGAMVFGMWRSFILTFSAVLLGSFIVFALARTLGKKFVDHFIEAKTSGKYLNLINTKRDPFLLLAFLFPFFPDDILCILAGLTDIKTSRFMIIVLIARPWGLFFASAFGGSVIHIPTWAMILIGIAGAAIFILGMRYGDKIEEKLISKIKKAK